MAAAAAVALHLGDGYAVHGDNRVIGGTFTLKTAGLYIVTGVDLGIYGHLFSCLSSLLFPMLLSRFLALFIAAFVTIQVWYKNNNNP